MTEIETMHDLELERLATL